MTRTFNSRVPLALMASLAALAASQASAQQAHAQTGARAPQAAQDNAHFGDAIVVTARKRAESVSDAPVTIAVIGDEKLAATPLTNANELNGVVPGLVIMSGVGGSPGVTFRGLGSNSALFSVESSVALFVDGVYSAHPRDYVTPVYDLDRIEMVKGTQGTLLGKNTTLGAISMVTRRPGADFGYDLNASYNFKSDTPRIEGAINVPLGETLSVRVAGLFIDDNGYTKNSLVGDVPQTKDTSGRISLAWAPTPSLDFLLSYQHDRHRQTGQGLEILRDARAGTPRASRAAATGQTDFEALPDRRNSNGSNAVGDTAPAGPTPFDRQDSDRLNFVANLDLGGATLTSQTAYTDWRVNRLSDLDFVQANLFNLADEEKDKRFSQELRISSDNDGRFSYLAGVFYFHDDWTLNRTTYGYAPGPLTGRVTTFYNQKTETISAFGQVGYKLTDGLSASLGLRYTNEKKTANYLRLPGTGVLGGASPAIPQTALRNSENDVDGDIGLQYKFAPGKMIYVSASKGSKGGGFQNGPATLAGAAYTGETAYTYEIGGKFVFDHATLDVAIFRTDVKDYQFSRTMPVGDPPLAQTVVTNMDVRSQGIEVNGSVRPTDWLRLSGGLVYADSVFRETVLPIATKGLRQPRAPELSGTFDALVRAPIGGDMTLNILGNVEYASRTYFQPNFGANLNAPYRDDAAKLNLRVGIESGSGWEVAVLGRNLTNVTVPEFVTSVSGTGAGPTTNTPAWYGMVSAPRAFLVQLMLKR